MGDKMSELSGQKRWEAMLRGQVMSATINKLSVIMRLADQKAQVLIFLNSILIPVCLNQIDHEPFQVAAVVSIISSVMSILAAMICIYPKRRYRKSSHRDINLLHFNDIGHLEKDEFMDMFMPVYNDGSKLGKAVVYDIYDMSRYSIVPKFTWLKVSYGIFAVGNLLAIIMVLLEV
tara:strand:+ start:22410 stop:22937 length:528 start_codon:yes stop_codon:yes gene_type:complete